MILWRDKSTVLTVLMVTLTHCRNVWPISVLGPMLRSAMAGPEMKTIGAGQLAKLKTACQMRYTNA